MTLNRKDDLEYSAGAEQLNQSLSDSLKEICRQAGEATDRLHAESAALDREFQVKMRTYQALRSEEQAAGQGAPCCDVPPPPRQPGGRPRRRRRGFFRSLRLIVTLLLLIGALVAGLHLWDRIQDMAALTDQFSVLSELPEAAEALLPDPEMGYTDIDFQNAILGETRDKSDLVVREQDIQVDSRISQALVNISIFEKTKTVHSFGTGVYTVDLSGVTSEKIVVDLDRRHITVTIPHAELRYVEIDPEKTVFEDTDRAFLAFGDITLTSEQQQMLQSSVQETMRAHLLEEEHLLEADQLAREKVFALLNPVVQAISAEFTLHVHQAS